MEEGRDTIQAKKRAIHDDTHIWGKTDPTFGGNRALTPLSVSQSQSTAMANDFSMNIAPHVLFLTTYINKRQVLRAVEGHVLNADAYHPLSSFLL